MATKKKPFPSYLYVTRENEGTEDEYLGTYTKSAAEALTSTDTVRVAVYKLEETKVGRLEPVFE